ncbi:MAG TPA: tRNA (adenosine(37)-N6)-threonylcarbamoyltransferase complex dimerization subunit type 1 TsaB [Papillibacter sp.]|jgi:tRNA threonylcarbamoyladenosine biosynthesis protein TsaB|nr:tRNA (adenosine(37)-N6)-threonylcarbamoyltransferase complex dimerization subunit type 1 TsaB [Papillibacter sp.]HHT16166.1 tRNA (adenosine(37)-N6)-threonylcarbamoyltransferase complex dimerization subunit type 1 TsaB [Papillibacter sp.]
MNILAFESSAKAASVALCDGGGFLLAQSYQNTGLTHSATLMKMAEDLLKNINTQIADLSLIAVAAGPGSFTGVRIGVSAAIGLAWGADLDICGVSTLEAMAYHVSEENVLVCPVMDARRNQVYNGLFMREKGGITRLCEDRALSIEELMEDVASRRLPCVLVGDGARLCYDAFTKASVPCSLAHPMLQFQSAWGVAQAALNGRRISPLELQPSYLRLSQAERERLSRSGAESN